MPSLTEPWPRVGVDGTPILPGKKGLGRFLEGLLDAWHERRFPHPRIVYVDSKQAAEAQERWPSFPIQGVRSLPASAWERWGLPRQAAEGQLDVLLTGRDRTLLEPARRTVVYLFEIPDHRRKAGVAGASWLGRLVLRDHCRRFRRVAEGASFFVTSSNATASDLRTRYGVSASRIKVCYPGLQKSWFHDVTAADKAEARARLAGGSAYVMHIASGDTRDNSAVALRAFAVASQGVQTKHMMLVVARHPAERDRLAALAADLGIMHRISFHGYFDDRTLQLAFRGAAVYLDPSLYEGFGFQLAEALASAVPVVGSNVTAVPEIVGPGGVLRPPEDVIGIAEALRSILLSERRQAELGAAGRRHAEQFSWDRCLEPLLLVLARIPLWGACRSGSD